MRLIESVAILAAGAVLMAGTAIAVAILVVFGIAEAIVCRIMRRAALRADA